MGYILQKPVQRPETLYNEQTDEHKDADEQDETVHVLTQVEKAIDPEEYYQN